ncbi:Sensor protein FixL [Posidoniimonas polymericola]|uniref:histidine kinase n=1 Tax=Posidoniimonas polymericola TaxID=2528002 RepID=A0A5C5YRT8_9BACT|nr:PAS domain-containing protein [Posidoniimonas polymericola]TWT77684.1 Sensor protein FixL [Posidoniimonas polymericola]
MPSPLSEPASTANLAEQLAEERRRREVAEAQLDRRYERLTDNPAVDYFIYAADNDSRLTYVSPSVARILGFQPSAMVGRDWREFVDAASSTYSMAEENELALLDGADSPTKVIMLKCASGRSAPMEVTPRTLHSPSGSVIGHEGMCKAACPQDEVATRLRAISDELEVSVRRRTSELEYRIEFEKVLVSLSTGFINLTADDVDEAIDESLRRVGEFLGVDRCSIRLFEDRFALGELTHEWYVDGCASLLPAVSGLCADEFEWELGELASGRHFMLDDTSHAPVEAKCFRMLYEKYDVRSALHYPLMIGDALTGMVNCATVGRRFRWRDEHLALIRVFVEVVGNTLERLDSQRRLAESERRLHEIVRDQTEMIIRWTAEGGHRFVNDAVSRFLGKPADQIIGTPVLDNVHREDLARVRKKLAGLTPEAPLAVDEHRVVRTDGSLAWYQWVDRALFDDRGNFIEYQSVGRDITGLKRTQEELERRLNFEELVLGISTRLINPPLDKREETLSGVLEELGEFTGVDRSFIYLLDQARQEWKLRYYWSSPTAPPVFQGVQTIPVDSLPWPEESIRRGVPFHMPSLDSLPENTTEFRAALVAMHTKSFINVPMLAEGQVVGYMGFATHQHERTWTDEEIALLRLIGEILVSTMARDAAERASEENRELLRLAIEGVEEGVYDWDIEHARVVVSDHWLRTLGLPPGENSRSEDAWRERIHPDDWDQAERAMHRHFAGETPVFEAEYRIRHADGQFRWNLNRGRVIRRSESGRPLRMVGVDRDITDMIEAREKRRVLEAQLAHLGRVATMGETVAGIAHEVNQPLHAAATFNAAARSALSSGKTEKAESLYQKSSEQISRAGDIIRHMREYTRPRQTDITFLDINQLLRRSAEFVMGYNTHAQASLIFDLEEGLPQVQGDAVQLQQVAVNLIQNGVDAIRDGGVADGEIRISTRLGERAVEVRVSDNGKGADAEDPDELFNAFFSTKPQGMGIGLALCRRIVETHNGVIQASQNEQAGMTFTVRIPVAESND